MKRYLLTAVLLYGAAAAQTSFGPIVLGQRLPALPKCQMVGDSEYELVPGQGPCIKTDRVGLRHVENVAFDALDFTHTAACYRANDNYLQAADANCPVAGITMRVSKPACDDVLSALRKKFGTPTVTTRTVQNAFGATWQQTFYQWSPNRDSVTYVTHMELRGNCFLNAMNADLQAEEVARHPKPTF